MIEFIEDIHLYLVDGVITPSVTQILAKHGIGTDYSAIPRDVVKAKAAHGNAVHASIEKWAMGEYISRTADPLIDGAVDTASDILTDKEIEIESCEEVVAYKNLYAGKYDMFGYISGKTALFDIKTTASLNKKYLSWQLSMYNLALQNKAENLYCLWLPKNKPGKLVEIEPKTEEEIINLLNG